MGVEKIQLQKMIDTILKETQGRGKLEGVLKELVQCVEKQPLLLWNTEAISGLAKVSLRALLLDVIEDEEQEIAWAQKVFAYITQSLLKSREDGAEDAKLFDILKDRVILLHSHDDFFVDILDYFFFHNTPITQETDRLDRRAFILERVAAMQAQDLKTLENYDKNLKNDAYLLDVEETILSKYEFKDTELVEAQLLSDTLFKYIWFQYNKKTIFQEK